MQADNSYSVKEILTEMKLDQREHHERVLRMEAILNEVHTLAKQTNGRVTKLEGLVATNTLKIDALETDVTRAKAIYGTAAAIFGAAWTFITWYFR